MKIVKQLFAHGGSGIVMSNAALTKMVSIKDTCLTKFSKLPFGDVPIGYCLKELGIEFSFDAFNGFSVLL